MFVVFLKSLNQVKLSWFETRSKNFLNSAYNIFKLDKPFTFDDLAGTVKQDSSIIIETFINRVLKKKYPFLVLVRCVYFY